MHLTGTVFTRSELSHYTFLICLSTRCLISGRLSASCDYARQSVRPPAPAGGHAELEPNMSESKRQIIQRGSHRFYIRYHCPLIDLRCWSESLYLAQQNHRDCCLRYGSHLFYTSSSSWFIYLSMRSMVVISTGGSCSTSLWVPLRRYYPWKQQSQS